MLEVPVTGTDLINLLTCCLQVKENLLSCKMLLHCKRDELRKLWIEGIEHKHVLNLLDEIENIKQVPQKLEQCMASKHYLNATDMLVRCSTSCWTVSTRNMLVSCPITCRHICCLCYYLLFFLLLSFFGHLLLSCMGISVWFCFDPS